MEQYEYRVTVLEWPPIHKAPNAASVQVMNDMGAQGWELVTASPRTDAEGYIRETTLIWKRKKGGAG
jgi:hypothetical protein